MDSPFRLMVYAIVTVLIIAIVLSIFLPAEENTLSKIEKSLQAAEVGLGKGFSNELMFRQGEGFVGETFDSRTRNVAFLCNSSSLCCPQGEECALAIEWDNRLIKFNQTRGMLATTRCGQKQGVYTCTVYMGEKPAQIEIESVEAPKEIDLGSSQLAFDIAFKNTGNQTSFQAEASVEIFQRYLEDDKWVEKRVEGGYAVENIGELEPGQYGEKTVYISLNQNGNFRAVVRVSGLEAGFDEKSIQFGATGALDNCMPAYCDKPGFTESKCTARCYCQGCMLGSKCAELLLESVNVDLGLDPKVELKNAGTEFLGSNIVDLFLSNDSCEKDAVEPDCGIECLPEGIPSQCIVEPTTDPDSIDPSCLFVIPDDYWIAPPIADPSDIIIE